MLLFLDDWANRLGGRFFTRELQRTEACAKKSWILSSLGRILLFFGECFVPRVLVSNDDNDSFLQQIGRQFFH